MSNQSEKKSSQFKQLSLKASSILTDAGLNVSYERDSRNSNGRVKIQTLTLHFAKPSQTSQQQGGKDIESLPEGDRESEKPQLVSLRSELTLVDSRARSRKSISVSWKYEKPDQVFVTENGSVRNAEGGIAGEESASNHVELSQPFDPRAVQVALMIQDDKATMEFLNKYLPDDFLLNA